MPRIDQKSGKWDFHTVGAMNDVKTAMNACKAGIMDLLLNVNRKIGGVETPTTPLIQVLNNFNSIDKKISASLANHKAIICGNHAKIRQFILDDLSKELNASASNTELHSSLMNHLREAINKESSTDRAFMKGLPLNGAVGPASECFGGLDFFNAFMTKYRAGGAGAVALKDSILEQEKDKLDTIVFSINSFVAMYEKFTAVFNTTCTRDILEADLATAFKLNGLERGYFATETQDKSIATFLEYLIMERVELLYCHVHTFFAACVGRSREKTQKLASNFVRSAVIGCMLPLLESRVPSSSILSNIYASSNGSKDSAGDNVIQAVFKGQMDFISLHETALFTNFTPTELTDDLVSTASWEIKHKIHETIWGKHAQPSLTSKVYFNDLTIAANLNQLTEIVGGLKQVSSSLQSTYKDQHLKSSQFLITAKLAVDKAADHIFYFVQAKVDPAVVAAFKFSFAVASNVIYYNQRTNPAFASSFIFKGYEAEVRLDTVKWYFHSMKNPIYITEKTPEGVDKVLNPPTSVTWDTRPTTVTFDLVSTAHTCISALKLENVDVISPLIERKSNSGNSTLKNGTVTFHKNPKSPATKSKSDQKPKNTKDKKARPKSAPSTNAKGK